MLRDSCFSKGKTNAPNETGTDDSALSVFPSACHGRHFEARKAHARCFALTVSRLHPTHKHMHKSSTIQVLRVRYGVHRALFSDLELPSAVSNANGLAIFRPPRVSSPDFTLPCHLAPQIERYKDAQTNTWLRHEPTANRRLFLLAVLRRSQRHLDQIDLQGSSRKVTFKVVSSQLSSQSPQHGTLQ